MPPEDNAPADKRVVIRRAKPADAERLAAIYNEAVMSTTATFDIEPKTVGDRREWLGARGERYPVLVAELDGTVAGYASLTRWSSRAAYDDTAETGVYVHSSYRGRGIGRRLYAEIIDEARRLQFHTLIARVTSESSASIRLNEAAGFVSVGTMRQVGRKFGRLLDVLIMQKMLD